MVLMKFRDSDAAHDYYTQYNDRRFSSMEVRVLKMKINKMEKSISKQAD